VSTFRLDKYEVTVGRFRQFANAVLPPDGGAGWLPAAGTGKHTHLNGGQGLVDVGAPPDAGTVYETGWDATDNSDIAPTNENLASCVPYYGTWTTTAQSNENLPINCVTWYEAYAFCIWDGGFLPSDDEWEYAAAGGAAQLEYPWGMMAPGTANQYAIYDCYYPSGTTNCVGVSNIAPVGTATLGAGLWGQLDMDGDVDEWNLDWYEPYVDPCVDCAFLTPVISEDRVMRGGDFSQYTYTAANTPPPFPPSPLLPPDRSNASPSVRNGYIGFRCARTP